MILKNKDLQRCGIVKNFTAASRVRGVIVLLILILLYLFVYKYIHYVHILLTKANYKRISWWLTPPSWGG